MPRSELRTDLFTLELLPLESGGAKRAKSGIQRRLRPVPVVRVVGVGVVAVAGVGLPEDLASRLPSEYANARPPCTIAGERVDIRSDRTEHLARQRLHIPQHVLHASLFRWRAARLGGCTA